MISGNFTEHKQKYIKRHSLAGGERELKNCFGIFLPDSFYLLSIGFLNYKAGFVYAISGFFIKFYFSFSYDILILAIIYKYMLKIVAIGGGEIAEWFSGGDDVY